MPLNSTRGAGSAKGFGLTAGSKPWDGNNVDYLIVAGGGGGSWGGGGAGGFRTFTNQSLTANSPYPVTIGAGGAGYPDNTQLAPSGNPSSFNSQTSTGGGGGSGFIGQGADGGSGGGGGGFSPTQGGTGNSPPVSPSQGNPGGAGNTDVTTFTNGGAGGGAGGAASPGPGTAAGAGSPVTAIFGAAPQPFYLTDIPTAGAVSGGYFAGGGGGTNQQPGATPFQLGGIGGGGNQGESGVQNSGGGSGGVAYAPKSGGSGIVMIKVPAGVNVTVTPGTNTVTSSGGSKIAKFTVPGTFLGK
jgi:hypothetical protein